MSGFCVDEGPAPGEMLAILERIPAAQIVVRSDAPVFTVLAVSDGYLRMTAANRADLMGRGIFEATLKGRDNADIEQLRASFDRVVASKAADGMQLDEYSFHQDGSKREHTYWQVLNTPVGFGNGTDCIIHSVERHTVETLPVTAQTGAAEPQLAEEKLRHQWQAFDPTLSHISDFAYTFDLEGRLTYVNQSLLNLLRKPLDEALGKNFFDLGYPPDLAERLQGHVKRVVDTKELVRDETPFAGPAGEVRHYEYIFVPVLSAEGQLRAVAGSTRDVTERAKAEEMIHQDRRRWRELLEQAPAGVAVFKGPRHTFEWVNGTFLKMIGLPDSQIIGKTVQEALPAVTYGNYLGLLDHVFKSGEPFVGKESLLRLEGEDGTLTDGYVNFVCAATRDSTGNIDGIFAHATDVTDLVLSRKQIEVSESQFRTLAESIPHLAWMADEAGDIFWYNRRWFEFTGTTLEEMKGWGWQKVHDPNVLPEVKERWKQAISSGEPFDMTFPLRGADGEYRSFLTRVEPVRNNAGNVIRWFGTNTDITSQQQTEDELRRTNRELEEFSHIAGHDLREPLRMLSIYTELLLRKIGGGEGEIATHANVIRQSVGRMDALLQDLLTFSQARHAEEVSGGQADLAASLREALASLTGQISDTGAHIECEELPVVRGDTAQLAHVFQNLLSNAMKYRREDVPLEIKISKRADGDRWTISVKDNGAGFDARYAQQIFGLFKRLHGRDYPGTGLGLAICKRIIERYGGKIWAESEAGKGSEFHFTLFQARKSEKGVDVAAASLV